MSVIGKNPNLSVNGIRPARTLLPTYNQVIGDCSNLFNTVLPFSKLTFARDGSEYIRFADRMIKQANANQPATINIGGRVFMQSGPALLTSTTYSEVFRQAISAWINTGVVVTDNSIASPTGEVTADLLKETALSEQHRIYWQPFATDGSSRYFFYAFVKSKERNKCRLYSTSDGFVAAPNYYFDLTNKVPYAGPGAGNCDYYGLIPLSNDWCFIYIAATSNAVSSSPYDEFYFSVCNDSYVSNYQGDGVSGLYLWGLGITKSPILPSYVYTGSSPGAKPKTEPYFAEAVVPSWMRNRFYFEIYTHQYTSAMLASDGGEKHWWSFDATAGAVRCYMDGGDSNKIKVDLVGTGNIITSAATTPTLDGRIRCWLTFDDGSNSVLRVVGAGIDAEYTGVQLAAADGNVHWGQRDDATLQPSCLISQAEKF